MAKPFVMQASAYECLGVVCRTKLNRDMADTDLAELWIRFHEWIVKRKYRVSGTTLDAETQGTIGKCYELGVAENLEELARVSEKEATEDELKAAIASWFKDADEWSA